MVFQAGEIILDNTYRVEGLAGKGAFGEVYRVTHLNLNSTRAIKVLRTDSLIPEELQKYRDRFQTEAQLTDHIKHTNVVQVYDFIEKNGVFYLVMEYLEGGTLRDTLNAKKQLSIEETISLALNLCDGLAAIHRADVVHRDLHPRNILFDSSGVAKIADLGVAQFPGRTLTYGTSQPGDSYYQSPEQEHNVNHLYPTSDIFSLGCVLFELLTGKKYKTVFGARTHDHRRDVPKWLDEIVARALIEETSLKPSDDANPHKRYRTAELVRAAIEKGQAAFDWAMFFNEIVEWTQKLWREFWQILWWFIKKFGPTFAALLIIGSVVSGASKWIEANNVNATQTAVYIASLPTAIPTPTRTVTLTVTQEPSTLTVSSTSRPTISQTPTFTQSPILTFTPASTLTRALTNAPTNSNSPPVIDSITTPDEYGRTNWSIVAFHDLDGDVMSATFREDQGSFSFWVSPIIGPYPFKYPLFYLIGALSSGDGFRGTFRIYCTDYNYTYPNTIQRTSILTLFDSEGNKSIPMNFSTACYS